MYGFVGDEQAGIDAGSRVMSELVIDLTREDRDRRMRLLEMAGGDLEKAMAFAQWVDSGLPPGVTPVTITKAGSYTGASQGPMFVVTSGGKIDPPPPMIMDTADDGLDIPPFLKRNPDA